MAVLPSEESETELPSLAAPTAPVPTSLLSCCVHTPPERVHTHADPASLLSRYPPTMAVLPSEERETEVPWYAPPTAPVPTSLLPCCVHTPPERVHTHAAPAALLSPCPPTMAVLPSEEREIDWPCAALPTAPVPTSLLPCCVHTPPERVNTHAAPAVPLSKDPPTMAVLPSEEMETEEPCRAAPTAPVPTSLLPCCVHTPPERVHTHAAPAPLLSKYPPTMAVLPSNERETEVPWPALPIAPVPTSLLPCWAH